MTQCESILECLQSGRTLTPLEMYSLCGSLAGHSRISELRERGYDIECEMIEVSGKRVGRYSMRQAIPYG